MESKRPSARGAVKTGEAARKAGCLDGEHDDGSATVAGVASARGAPFPVSHVSKSTPPAAGRAVRGKRKVAESEMQLGCALPFDVLAGLVPAIPRRMRSIRPHAAPLQTTFEVVGDGFWAWMPGTRPRLSGSARPVVNLKSHTSPRVVPGLVPGIHAVRKPPTSKVSCIRSACGRMLRIRLGIAGTSPAKTPRGSIPLRFSRLTGLFS